MTYRAAAARQPLVALVLHSQFGGRPLIAGVLAELFEYIAAHPDVWFARHDDEPPRFPRDDERLVYEAISELVETKRLSDSSYERLIGMFGLGLTVELITNAGRYTQAAMVINKFEIMPADAERFF